MYQYRHSIQSPPASTQRSHCSYNESNAPENASSRIAFSSIATVRWIDGTASNLVPFIAGAKSGQWRGWHTTGIHRFAKNWETTPEECAGALGTRRWWPA
jgi:hypothetical protein